MGYACWHQGPDSTFIFAHHFGVAPESMREESMREERMREESMREESMREESMREESIFRLEERMREEGEVEMKQIYKSRITLNKHESL